MNDQEYLQERVEKQQKYFSGKAGKYKTRHYALSVAKLAASLAVTALSAKSIDFASPRSVIIAVLAFLVAFIEGIALLYRYNETWVSYRLTSEKLKREEFLYKTRAGEYDRSDDQEAFKLLVQKTEAIIQNSNNDWQERFHKPKGDNSKAGA